MHLKPEESIIYGQRRTDPESSAKNEHDARTGDSSVPTPFNHPPGLSETQTVEQRLKILSQAVISVMESDIAKITYGEILSGLFLNETRNSMRGQRSKYTPYNGYGYSEEEDARRRSFYLAARCNRDAFRPELMMNLLRPQDYNAYLEVPMAKFDKMLIFTVVKVVRQVTFDLYSIRQNIREDIREKIRQAGRHDNVIDDNFIHPDHEYLSQKLHEYPCARVSHWAESRIFGGLVGKDTAGIWVFSDREGSPQTRWQPRRHEWDDLLHYFAAHCPLPFQHPFST